MSARPPRIAFVVEQALGHATHADNLHRLVAPDARLRAEFALIPYEPTPRWSRVPGYGNWTVRASGRARSAVRALRRSGAIDAMFVHTQVPATLMPDLIRRTPSVISLDATPLQYDELGEFYAHQRGSARVERLKWRLHRHVFSQARMLVTWSDWAKQGLTERYEVPAGKVVVIAPGVDYALWSAAGDEQRRPSFDGGPMRVLFVGGDFARKGGHDLVDAVRRLRAKGVAIEADLVTRDPVEGDDAIRVHHGLGPNSSALMDLYRRADVFALPTLGDCLPMVLPEAGAMGLPLVSTSVGAIGEVVRDDVTGLLVPPGDSEALAAALDRLAQSPAMRRSLGDAAREHVRAHHDAATNANHLVELLLDVTPQS
ncbi:MAG TPA: glycosyltransferase family 4 protein [Ilumatobacter sp.]|nr:glycosyltransferase family 4 protein [Ilumatobacter sp.]